MASKLIATVSDLELIANDDQADTPALKADGDPVAADDIIGLVEVMKSFHEIRAGVAGNSIRFLVDNEDAVMAGDVLAEIDA